MKSIESKKNNERDYNKNYLTV